MKNIRLPVSIIIIVFTAIAIYRFNFSHTSIPDDAFIFFRYAENIANGFGFVYNVNSIPVEGFSSFLYLMLLTLFEYAGLKAIDVFVYVGITCSILTLLVILYYLLRILKVGYLPASITLLLIILSPNFLYYTTSGMETPLYSLLVIFSIVISVKSYMGKNIPFLSGFIWGLTSLVRLEAIAVLLMLISVNFFLDIKNSSVDRKYYYKLLVGFLLIFVPYFIWRWNHFGNVFPNTFYGKTGGGLYQISGGIQYVLNSFWENFGGTSVVLIFLLVFISKKNIMQYTVFIPGILVFYYSFLISMLGGDHFGYGRFLTPVFLILFLLAGLALENFFKILNYKKLITVVAIVFISFCILFRSLKVGIFPVTHNSSSFYESGINEYDWIKGFMLMGKELKKIEAEKKSIALVPIGAIGYYSDYEIIDMLGLIDPVIAKQRFDNKYISTWRPGHDKGDGRYILNRKPYFIQLTDYITKHPQRNPGEFNMQYKSIEEIWESEYFHNNYEFFPIKMPGGYYNLYRRTNNL